jgi:hypothetical protein
LLQAITATEHGVTAKVKRIPLHDYKCMPVPCRKTCPRQVASYKKKSEGFGNGFFAPQ